MPIEALNSLHADYIQVERVKRRSKGDMVCVFHACRGWEGTRPDSPDIIMGSFQVLEPGFL